MRGGEEPTMNMDAVIRSVQEVLGVTADGQPGPETWAAIFKAITGTAVPETAPFDDKVDARSETVVSGLAPEVRTYARTLVHRAAGTGIDVRVISGLRTYAEQDALFAQGRTKPGARVTNAKGGESNHNFGIAFDVGVFDGKTYLPESPAYDAVGAIGHALGLEWGGGWHGLVDKPHFELRPAWAARLSETEMLAELRTRKDNGAPFFA
jgi:peptidoglycan L-alanyl-D-glutamate endopeptidase CwlK